MAGAGDVVVGKAADSRFMEFGANLQEEGAARASLFLFRVSQKLAALAKTGIFSIQEVNQFSQKRREKGSGFCKTLYVGNTRRK